MKWMDYILPIFGQDDVVNMLLLVAERQQFGVVRRWASDGRKRVLERGLDLEDLGDEECFHLRKQWDDGELRHPAPKVGFIEKQVEDSWRLFVDREVDLKHGDRRLGKSIGCQKLVMQMSMAEQTSWCGTRHHGRTIIAKKMNRHLTSNCPLSEAQARGARPVRL